MSGGQNFGQNLMPWKHEEIARINQSGNVALESP